MVPFSCCLELLVEVRDEPPELSHLVPRQEQLALGSRYVLETRHPGRIAGEHVAVYRPAQGSHEHVVAVIVSLVWWPSGGGVNCVLSGYQLTVYEKLVSHETCLLSQASLPHQPRSMFPPPTASSPARAQTSSQALLPGTGLP